VATVIAVTLAAGAAFQIGALVAPRAGTGPVAVRHARVLSVGVGTDRASACGGDTTIGGDPTTLLFGLHVMAVRPGLHVTLAITGAAGTDYLSVMAPQNESGCVLIPAPASVDHAEEWNDGDYAVSVLLGLPGQGSGPVTAFEIQSGDFD